ncbi:class I SAM-dependent methyltransferase [Haloarcula halophila]|uniref:class I SAM-dependent methyltransferase n=1 Tax=Haloarcula TaxID=2237 RepID=UPI0023E39C5C|nr:class I SAM-dependent methyltransferase [Halomicroarcula sp. DFY41]
MGNEGHVSFWKSHFDQQVEQYTAEHEILDFSNEKTMKQIHDITVNIAQSCLEDGDTVVDVGCGTGRTLALLVETSDFSTLRIIAVDISAGLLQQAQDALERVVPETTATRVLQSSILSLGIRDEGASVLICTEVLQYANPREGLKQLVDATQAHGTVVFSLPNVHNETIQRVVERNSGRYNSDDIGSIIRDLEQCTSIASCTLFPLEFQDEGSEQPYFDPIPLSLDEYTPDSGPNRYIVKLEL